jgi:hypothetical protein
MYTKTFVIISFIAASAYGEKHVESSFVFPGIEPARVIAE